MVHTIALIILSLIAIITMRLLAPGTRAEIILLGTLLLASALWHK